MRTIATTLLVALAVGACSGGEAAQPAPGTAPAAQAEPAAEPEIASSEPAAGSPAASPADRPREVPLPADLALDLEERHTNGTLVRVLGVSFAPTSMSVRIEAVNGNPQQIELNGFDAWIADDEDTVYRLVPPVENANMEIEPGATLTGDLTFLGELDRDATTLRLYLNVPEGNVQPPGEGSRVDVTPKFLFEIPLDRG